MRKSISGILKTNSEIMNDHITPKPFQKKSRSLESLETKSKRRTIEKKCNYKLSTQHIHFLMEQERMKELSTIQNSKALTDYYKTFNSLFIILYKTSKMILTYMYYNKTHQLIVDRLQVLNVLLGNFQDEWDQKKIKKMEILSSNLYEMSKDEKDFQKRIQYVSRKLCNNQQKREKIEKAFLNEKLKQFWKDLKQKTEYFEKNYFIQDMFLSYAEKLCFYDVRIFLNSSLSKIQFKRQIQKYCSKQELDQDLSMDYTFEFLLLQQFSFNDQLAEEARQIDQLQKQPQSKDSCEVM